MKMKNAVLSNFYKKKKTTSLMALSTLSKLRAEQFVNAQRTAEYLNILPRI